MLAVKIELPQLFDTVTVGGFGISLGAEIPLAEPVHPLAFITTTVYVAEFETAIEDAVDPLLHNNVPV